MPGCIYRLTFPNGKAYIGMTQQALSLRMIGHRRDAVKGQNILYRAWRKWGESSIRTDVLMVANGPTYLRAMETAAIGAFGTLSPGGYNMTGGGEGSADYDCPELRQKRRAFWDRPGFREAYSANAKAAWTEEKRAARAAETAALWQTEYGQRLREKYSSRPSRARVKVLLPPEVAKATRAAAMGRPETRQRMSESAKRASGERREKIADDQRRLMADQENTLRIARSLSPYADTLFVKVKKPVRGDFLRAIWDQIPDVATFDDLFRLGFRKNAVPRSLRNGNIRALTDNPGQSAAGDQAQLALMFDDERGSVQGDPGYKAAA